MVVQRASFHGITVLLGRASEMLSLWPEPVADALRHEMRLAALWEELHRTQIAAVIEYFAATEIEAMLLKGTALAYLYYDDPAMRRRGDTDLLIHPHDLAAARKALTQRGCIRREDPAGLVFQETWLIDCGAQMMHSIDLHWQPSDRPVLQKTLAPARFWDSRVPVPRLSPHAAAPTAELMLVHGAINQAWHSARGYNVEDDRVTGGRRLIWAVDYLYLTDGFDAAQWGSFADFCESTDAAAIVHSALDGAQRDIGLAVPADVMDRLGSARTASAGLTYITDPGVIRDFWRDLRAADNLLVRGRLIKGMLFAPRAHLVTKYPDRAHWPTGLLQLIRYSEVFMRWRRHGAKR